MKFLFLKTQLPRGIFLIPLLGGLLLASFWLVPGATHAASSNAVTSSITNNNNCDGNPPSSDAVVIATDNGEDVDCFSGSGTESVNLYNVIALDTNGYTLTFNWTGQNGSSHTSTKAPYTFLSAGNADGTSYFAGSKAMGDITSITLNPLGNGTPVPYTPCGAGDTQSSYIAGGSSSYYVHCIPDELPGGTSPYTMTVNLYNVYAIDAQGDNDYTLTFNWEDVNGNWHYNTTLTNILLAAGDADNKQGGANFAGADSIYFIQSITLTQIGVG